MPLALVVLLLAIVASAQEPAPRMIADGDAAGQWEGGSVDPELKKQGAASLRWAHAETPRIRLVDPPADWSSHRAIRFWIHNETASDGAFMGIFSSDNPASEGMDYYMAEVKLNFTGWKRVIILRPGMSSARNPLGWEQIKEVFFTADGWDNTPDPRVVVHIDALELVDVAELRTTDEELFEALDLDRPELAAVREAAAREDWAAARHALADYYRGREGRYWWFDAQPINRDIRADIKDADRAVAGDVTVISHAYAFPDGAIDWSYNPTKQRDDLPDNNEWQWQLNRMHFWGDLGAAYWRTGDEKYGQAFARQLKSWTDANPRPQQAMNGAPSNWRTIESGIRMGGAWPTAFFRFLHSPSFTDDHLIAYLKAAYDHAVYLSEHNTGGNWLTMEMSGLYSVAAVFPEFDDAAAWRRQAIGRLHEELNAQFQPDGAQVELTPGYHQVALGNVLKIPRLAKVVGRLDELPADYVERAAKAFEFNLKLMTPDRDMPKFNDSWHVNVPSSLREALELFPQRDDFRWVATDGQEGTPPEYVSTALPYAGYYAMRSGWGRDDNLLVLDAGPLGYGHMHQDKLNVVLWSHGREILYDDGGGSYESSPYRRYAIDTPSHNTVLVDGLAQQRDRGDMSQRMVTEPIDARWESSAAHDFAAGVYDGGYGKPDHTPAVHTRRVLYAKPDLYVVADTLTPSDDAEHSYEARWHLIDTAIEHDRASGRVATAADGKPNLAVIPLLTDGLEVATASARMEPTMAGWYVEKNGGYVPTTTVLHTRRGAGVQTFLTLLVPIPAGETVPLASVRAIDATTAEITLRDGDRLRIEASADPAGPITLTETAGDGTLKRTITGGD